MLNKIKKYYSNLPKEIILHGGHSDNDNYITLKAGKLSMLYENGSLRYIRAGKYEVVRMIFFALRVKNWLTIKPDITSIEHSVNNDSFKTKYKGHFKSGDVDFITDFIIEGKPDSSISFSFEGVALSSFMRNRIGFCLLHPLEGNTGKPCTVFHTDGVIEKMIFPELISPYQPFLDIKSFMWPVSEGSCRIDYSGDVFETEDQRNWTDSSFKTYSTPLSLPYPVAVEKGTRISQSVLLRINGNLLTEPMREEPVRIIVSPDENLIFPKVGISRSSRNIKLSPSEAAILKKVKFDHYRVELHLFEKDWKDVADEVLTESNGLGCKIEFALVFDDNFLDQTTSFLEWASSGMSSIAFLLLFHKSWPVTPDELSQKVIPVINNALPGVKTGTGTNANFAQLNRNRPTDSGSDFICYSIQPQEHESDNSTLVENLEAQAHTVRSAIAFSQGKDILISPVTIQRRFNANNVFFEVPSENTGIPPQVDSRMMSLFGACWTAGSLKNLILSGVAGITVFETAGERGIIQGDLPSRWPAEFRSDAGMIFPVFHVLRFILSSKSSRIVKSVSSDPLKVESLVISDGKKIRMVLVNFTGENQAAVPFQLKGQFNIREMNETNFPEVVSDRSWLEKPCETRSMSHDTIILSPFSVTFIEGYIKL